MKPKRLLVLTLVMLMAATGTALSLELGVKAGFNTPVGDYGDYFDTGFTLGGQLKAPLTPFLVVGGHVAYTGSEGDVHGADADATMVEVYPFLDFYPMRTGYTDLFFRAGLGLNAWEIEIDRHEGWGSLKSDDTDLMMALGVGINFLNNFEITAIYNRVFVSDDDIDYFTFTIGYNFDLM